MKPWILVYRLYSKTKSSMYCKYGSGEGKTKASTHYLCSWAGRWFWKTHLLFPTYFLPSLSMVIHKTLQGFCTWIWIATFYLLLLKINRKPHLDSPDGPFFFHDESKNWGVSEQSASSYRENWKFLQAWTPDATTLTVIYALKLQENSSSSPRLKSLLSWTHRWDVLLPLPAFQLWALCKGDMTHVWAAVWLPQHKKCGQEERWHLPRLARLRVRTPSAMVLSPAMEQVLSTAFMFSCSAASSAYCRPWGWLWQGGELLENLPDCGRKRICCFNWEQHKQ